MEAPPRLLDDVYTNIIKTTIKDLVIYDHETHRFPPTYFFQFLELHKQHPAFGPYFQQPCYSPLRLLTRVLEAKKNEMIIDFNVVAWLEPPDRKKGSEPHLCFECLKREEVNVESMTLCEKLTAALTNFIHEMYGN
jgi:hypothetical protein